MSENFLICIKAVAPMFIMISVGCLVRLSGMVNDDELNKFNKMVFHTLFPMLMFSNIYHADIREIVDIRLIIFAVAAVFAVYFTGMAIAVKTEKSSRSRGALIQAIYRSNFVIMGLPIATNIYGHSNVGVTAVMVAIIVPIFNILAVITLETYKGSAVNPRKIVMGIVTNPLIIGIFTGLVFSLLSIPLPGILEDTVSEISAAANPMALIILGASFRTGGVRECRKNLITAVLMRLVIVPGIVLTVAMLLGIKDIAFVTLVSIFAAPCAISSFTMALEMKSDANLAGNAVIFTSALSCFTMFGWLLIFKSLGVF